MKRKGQYLAVESVLTFGLGLIVAIGTVTLFTSYREQVVNSAAEKQVDVTESRLLQAVHTLENTDSGHVTVDLPEKMGSQEYTMVMSEKQFKVALPDGTEHVTSLEQFQGYRFSGTAEGGSVKVFKRGDEFTLRAN